MLFYFDYFALCFNNADCDPFLSKCDYQLEYLSKLIYQIDHMLYENIKFFNT